MGKIKILHLTDLHFSGNIKYKENQERLIDSLINSLEAYKNKVDFVFFTGDLVWSGEKLEDFYSVQTLLIDRLCETLLIKRTNFFICPGNHDVFRGQELDDISTSIATIETNEDLENFVMKSNNRSLKASLENLENYYEFQKAFYSKHVELGDIQVDNLYSSHIREFDGKRIGITTINSAWRANDSSTDSGRLMFPLNYLKKASNEVKNCDIKILILHHPLSDFKWWNKQRLEDVIYKDYHLLFSGHVHINRDTLHITNDVGIYHSTASATLSSGNDKIGFTIIDTDIDSFELEIVNSIYDKSNEIFYYGESIPAQIPVSRAKQELNKFRITIRKRFEEKLDEANKLFLSYKELDRENNFLSMFTQPIIKNDSQSNPKTKDRKKYTLEEIVNYNDKNQIIFGKDKSGKSAILYKLVLDILNQFGEVKILPVYIDCNSVINSDKEINVIDVISKFYEINKKNAEELSHDYHIKILLDNFKENENLILRPVEKYLKANKNSSILATANETLFISFTGGLIGEINFENLYLHEITRSEIRLLTNKWPNIAISKRELILDKIHTVFNQLNIPSNYWTVSLFIWIFEKNLDANLGNNFQLINLYVDNLLDKENFILSNKYKIDFNDLKEYLSEIAHFMVSEHIKQNYRITYYQLIEFTEKYKIRNKRFVIETDEITKLIIDKGIIKKETDNLYTFRLNGVFEYFLGYYMHLDSEFRNSIIDDGHFYLSFGNEFEICAGLIPTDKDFVEKIFTKTDDYFNSINANIDFNNIDAILLSKVHKVFNISSDLPKILKETLTAPMETELQDSILESFTPSDQRISEVKLKKYYDSIGSEVDDLEKALYILGRVYRNSKLRDSEDFNNKVFDYILNSTCSLSFSLINEVSSQNLGSINKNITEDQLIKLLTQFLPIVAQTFFFDMAVQVNLENILKEKIEKLKKNKKGNELKLMILYFSLIDLDLKNNESYISELIEEIKIPVLKQTSLFKLYLYLSFKVNGNDNLRRKIEGYLRRQELNLNGNTDIGEIEFKIANVNRENLNKR